MKDKIEEWKALAEKELKGKSSSELQWETDEGINHFTPRMILLAYLKWMKFLDCLLLLEGLERQCMPVGLGQ